MPRRDEVAPNASARVVRVSDAEAALRDDHEAGKALWAPGLLLGLFVVVGTFMRARDAGAR